MKGDDNNPEKMAHSIKGASAAAGVGHDKIYAAIRTGQLERWIHPDTESLQALRRCVDTLQIAMPAFATSCSKHEAQIQAGRSAGFRIESTTDEAPPKRRQALVMCDRGTTFSQIGSFQALLRCKSFLARLG